MPSSCFQKNDICQFIIALSLLACASSVSAHGAIHYRNGLWFDGAGFVERDFYSVDGVLREVFTGEVTEVDLEGSYVLPGFGNAHTHGIGNDAIPDESQRLLGAGVFYAANPNSYSSRLETARVALKTPDTVDAVFAGGGLTSTGGHPIQIFEGSAGGRQFANDAYFIVDDLAQLDETWNAILAEKPDFLKVYLEESEYYAARRDDPAYFGKRGLDPELIQPIVERAHGAGMRVAAHVTSRSDFQVAVRAGVDELAHLPLAALTSTDADEAAAHGVTVVTTVLSHRPYDGKAELQALHRENLRLLKAANVSLVLGTDSQASVVDELVALDGLGVFEPGELLHMLCVDTPRWIFPERKIGVFEPGAEASFVLLGSNPLADLGALETIAARVKSGHRIEIEAVEEERGIGQYLAHHMMANGLEETIAEYHRLREEEPDEWDFSEPQLNALGYAMMQHGKLVEATGIFQLNCEQYPESANVWDSLAESYMKRGEIEKAITNYERSLELNPENQGARDKLAELRSM